MGSGVAGALRRNAGGPIHDAAVSKGPVDLGEVVVPILGTGAAGLNFEVGVRRICETIDAYDPTTLTDVRVIAYSDAQYRTAAAITDRIRSANE